MLWPLLAVLSLAPSFSARSLRGLSLLPLLSSALALAAPSRPPFSTTLLPLLGFSTPKSFLGLEADEMEKQVGTVHFLPGFHACGTLSIFSVEPALEAADWELLAGYGEATLAEEGDGQEGLWARYSAAPTHFTTDKAVEGTIEAWATGWRNSCGKGAANKEVRVSKVLVDGADAAWDRQAWVEQLDEHLKPLLADLPTDPAGHNNVILITSLSPSVLLRLFDLASPPPSTPSPPSTPNPNLPPSTRPRRPHGPMYRLVRLVFSTLFHALLLIAAFLAFKRVKAWYLTRREQIGGQGLLGLGLGFGLGGTNGGTGERSPLLAPTSTSSFPPHPPRPLTAKDTGEYYATAQLLLRTLAALPPSSADLHPPLLLAHLLALKLLLRSPASSSTSNAQPTGLRALWEHGGARELVELLKRAVCAGGGAESSFAEGGGAVEGKGKGKGKERTVELEEEDERWMEEWAAELVEAFEGFAAEEKEKAEGEKKSTSTTAKGSSHPAAGPSSSNGQHRSNTPAGSPPLDSDHPVQTEPQSQPQPRAELQEKANGFAPPAPPSPHLPDSSLPAAEKPPPSGLPSHTAPPWTNANGAAEDVKMQQQREAEAGAGPKQAVQASLGQEKQKQESEQGQQQNAAAGGSSSPATKRRAQYLPPDLDLEAPFPPSSTLRADSAAIVAGPSADRALLDRIEEALPPPPPPPLPGSSAERREDGKGQGREDPPGPESSAGVKPKVDEEDARAEDGAGAAKEEGERGVEMQEEEKKDQGEGEEEKANVMQPDRDEDQAEEANVDADVDQLASPPAPAQAQGKKKVSVKPFGRRVDKPESQAKAKAKSTKGKAKAKRPPTVKKAVALPPPPPPPPRPEEDEGSDELDSSSAAGSASESDGDVDEDQPPTRRAKEQKGMAAQGKPRSLFSPSKGWGKAAPLTRSMGLAVSSDEEEEEEDDVAEEEEGRTKKRSRGVEAEGKGKGKGKKTWRDEADSAADDEDAEEEQDDRSAASSSKGRRSSRSNTAAAAKTKAKTSKRAPPTIKAASPAKKRKSEASPTRGERAAKKGRREPSPSASSSDGEEDAEPAKGRRRSGRASTPATAPGLAKGKGKGKKLATVSALRQKDANAGSSAAGKKTRGGGEGKAEKGRGKEMKEGTRTSRRTSGDGEKKLREGAVVYLGGVWPAVVLRKLDDTRCQIAKPPRQADFSLKTATFKPKTDVADVFLAALSSSPTPTVLAPKQEKERAAAQGWIDDGKKREKWLAWVREKWEESTEEEGDEEASEEEESE
ncbi:hypothetical protein JCM8097_000243 [Rhodosporidiobolus ruineniae]